VSTRLAPRLLVLCSLLAAGPGAAQAQPRPPQAAPKLTRAPKLVRFVEAPFPESERAAGRSAAVTVKVAINPEGAVDAVEVTESAGPAFDAAAVAAVRQFRFSPAEIDNKPAPIRILYRYEFVYRVEERKVASFVGVVRARGSKKPLPGVTVALDTGASATTDAAGRFAFDEVPPGKHAVTLSGDTFTALRTEETFELGKKVDASYDVQPRQEAQAGEEDDVEIVVTAPPLEKKVVLTEVDAAQGRRVPGTQGDVLKVVESLPGVGRSAAGSGALVVWGAAPQDTRVYVDGVRVPSLYHFGGLRSVIHSDLVRSVELAPGGYGAAYGRGLGGLVTVQTRELGPDGFHGSVAADLIDASAAVRWGGERWRAAVAGRRSHLDAVLGSGQAGKISEIFPIPRYHDGQAIVVYEPSQRERISFGGMLSGDEVERGTVSADPALVKRERRQVDWRRVFVRYERQLEDGSVVTLVPSVGDEHQSLVSRSGATPVEQSVDSKIYALRASYRGRVAPFLTVTTGLDAEVVDASLRRSGSVTSPGREGDIRVFGQAPSDQVNSDAWTSTIGSVAPHAEADWGLLDGRLHVIQGLRVEPFVMSGDRRTPPEGETPAIGYQREETRVQPRFAIRYSPTDAVTFKAAYGVYNQAPAPEDLSPVFGSPALGPARATHWLGGAAVQLGAGVSLDTTTFYTHSTSLSLRSPLSSPLLAEALVDRGEGRAFGSQVLLRKDPSRGFFGWVSYSIVRSERRSSPTGPYRLFDQDQTHVLTALGAYELGRGFEVGLRARYATGAPRTPVEGSYYDARRDLYEPLFGPQNSTRIPAFFQVDARASKRLKFGEKTELELYLDVQNITYRSNPEEFVYDRTFRQRRSITGLPILPVAGARFAW